ncbi:type I secretion system permease/ATPase [Litorivita pollutaquae]|uniref:Type I secretion system permease/ATPase n=1 Tax=Litorivita pollutaquae TaxID=2200892 RepID=A0A2V4NL92_9RHOB|nr:type I secretion system permease/ATPase [Litorivita pollutaquae]OUS19866.1 protease/lipase ABC transporter permease/ATP-binding protein [Rhodobacterales bacterium 59_46_T64]PYC47047.1 type I secretion system permease/ATPase [Litorivita pollutaquae]
MVTKKQLEAGRHELRKTRRESRKLYWAVGIFSFFANVLMLTGPLYMLQVYDRVLGSRSVATLVALSVLVLFLYTVMGVLDFVRGRIMGRVGAQFQSRLDRRVFEAVLAKSALRPDDTSTTGLRDLESVQRLMTSPALMALFDIPWTPFFLIAIAIFHPWLGLLALAGGLVLIALTVANQITTRQPQGRAAMANVHSEAVSEQMRNEAEMVQAMGMRDAAFDRWQVLRANSLKEQVHAADLGGLFSSTTKSFRLFLQSAMLGLGAYLVLQNELSPGAMIAGSILMGRALAPIELAIGQWAVVQRAVKGWENLSELLGEVPPSAPRTPLPQPQALLEVQQATIVPPGEAQAALRMVSFTVQPGQAVGVIGPSGAGKSSLARALTGVWRPAAGKIRLDGASLDNYGPSMLGQYIGYLPQRVQLFDGTIAENIGKLSMNPDPAKVVEAAKKADAHAMILKLPHGYDTQMSATSGRLSGGQIQRLGLARAMYGDPVILVLDEPNSNLDNEGSQALNRAIRQMKSEGRSVLIMAHRPSAIQECDMLLMLENGARVAYGPKEDVLREVVQNHKQIRSNTTPGGVR